MDAANRKVSVVIPTYNTNTFLSAAIESVLAQTYGVEEIIVIDDGSTDDPAAVLSGIADARLRVVRTENRGIAKARNLGCELATGDLVGFLDADDIWYPHKVERQLDVFAREPGTLVVGTQMHHIGRRDMAIGVTGVDEIDDAAQESVRTAYLMPFAISSALVDRDAYRAVGGFDPEIKDLGGVEDLDFISRVAALGPIRTVGEPLGAYRVHAGSTTPDRRPRAASAPSVSGRDF
jgi:glycosyltransferase involved in cell wall biosynthesis